ncbi:MULTISPECIES: MerR family transcriptional regulator [Streptomyces]|uniref:MerR family transcriptional regulator n=1 Tax=Streptomyces TaxID=1883 RepID=UPI00163C3111|nr:MULTISPECIES: MerR family transcriptional regulator [Streptomyces]MBC2876064.1 MerR family transcriptional regulator [Streptomyces sp. TYQ1024]UBI41181.1 MerR family transcriptional regulator [Streptomyces mobaraensis]UKW33674.1 MerR family transcriptional regulator [Streptomyces sp. TYQ1024]
MAELAEAAGIPLRTLRFYRERKLIPPPRREGRIAWYDGTHLTRLRTITALLERGHTLGGIADLLTAFESGRNVAELLNLDGASATPWSGETPARLSAEELADTFAGQVTAENLAAALDIGYLAVDGEEFVHVSRRLLDASTELVRAGVPLSAVLEAGRHVRAHADALAEIFTALIRTHLLPATPHTETGQVARTLEHLRPVSQAVVDAEVSMAMDRHIRANAETWVQAPEPEGSPGGNENADHDNTTSP